MFIANGESFGKKIFALAIPLSSINPASHRQDGGEREGRRRLEGIGSSAHLASGSGAVDAEELQDPVIPDPSGTPTQGGKGKKGRSAPIPLPKCQEEDQGD